MHTQPMTLTQCCTMCFPGFFNATEVVCQLDTCPPAGTRSGHHVCAQWLDILNLSCRQITFAPSVPASGYGTAMSKNAVGMPSANAADGWAVDDSPVRQDSQGVGQSAMNSADGSQAAMQLPHNSDTQNGASAQPVHPSLRSQACLKNVEFLENLRNPRNLQPVSLPVQLKLFSRIPVVMSARLFGQTGKPSEIYARLLVA